MVGMASLQKGQNVLPQGRNSCRATRDMTACLFRLYYESQLPTVLPEGQTCSNTIQPTAWACTPITGVPMHISDPTNYVRL